jgi:hypothetical protein
VSFPLDPFYGNCEAKFSKNFKRNRPCNRDYAKFYSHSHDAVIRVYDNARNLIETHEHVGDFKEQ